MSAILFGTNIAAHGIKVDIMAPMKGNLTGFDIKKWAAAAGLSARSIEMRV